MHSIKVYIINTIYEYKHRSKYRVYLCFIVPQFGNTARFAQQNRAYSFGPKSAKVFFENNPPFPSTTPGHGEEARAALIAIAISLGPSRRVVALQRASPFVEIGIGSYGAYSGETMHLFFFSGRKRNCNFSREIRNAAR